MCQQTLLGFCVALKQTFSNGTTFTVIKKLGKGGVIEIGTLFRLIGTFRLFGTLFGTLILCLTVL